MVGYAFPCTPEYQYGELLPEIPEHVRAGRLMGLYELVVIPAQAQGIGSRLHPALLKDINPDHVSLLIRPDNTDAQSVRPSRLHLRGPVPHVPGGPVYDLLLLKLDADAR